MSSSDDRLDRVDIVLTSPRIGGNVGSAARAMKNMGLGRLVIIEPEPVDPATFERDARRLAVEASDVLDAMRTVPTLDDAIHPGAYIVATSGKDRRDLPLQALREAAPEIVAMAAERRVAVVFGPEDHGLPNRILHRAHQAIAIPSTLAYPSLNLAQAVMLVAYELRLATLGGQEVTASPAVPQAELDALLVDAVDALDRIDFLKAHNRQIVLARLSGLLARATPSSDQVRMLRGICQQIRWLESRSRGSGEPV